MNRGIVHRGVHKCSFSSTSFSLHSSRLWHVFVHVNPVIPIDVAITKEFQENKAPWLQAFIVAVSFLGNQFLLLVLPILLTTAVFWLVKLRLEAFLVVILTGVSSLTNFLVKLLVSRPRSSAHLVDIFQKAHGQSFPSGHVMSYVAFWGLLFSLGLILFNRKRWWQYVLLIVSTLFVVLVGPSRICVSAH